MIGMYSTHYEEMFSHQSFFFIELVPGLSYHLAELSLPVRVENFELGVLLGKEEVVGTPVWLWVGGITAPPTPPAPTPCSCHGSSTVFVWSFMSCTYYCCQRGRGCCRRLLDMIQHTPQYLRPNFHCDHVAVLELAIDRSRYSEIVRPCRDQTQVSLLKHDVSARESSCWTVMLYLLLFCLSFACLSSA